MRLQSHKHALIAHLLIHYFGIFDFKAATKTTTTTKTKRKENKTNLVLMVSATSKKDEIQLKLINTQAQGTANINKFFRSKVHFYFKLNSRSTL